MNLILLRSSDNASYDNYLCPPKEMNLQVASVLVDEAVAKIKADKPDDHDFDDLANALDALGFRWPNVEACRETW